MKRILATFILFFLIFTASAHAQQVTVSLHGPDKVNTDFNIYVALSSMDGFSVASFIVAYNPNSLNFKGVSGGNFSTITPQRSGSQILINVPNVNGVDGSGSIATLSFGPKVLGTANISLALIQIVNNQAEDFQVSFLGKHSVEILSGGSSVPVYTNPFAASSATPMPEPEEEESQLSEEDFIEAIESGEDIQDLVPAPDPYFVIEDGETVFGGDDITEEQSTGQQDQAPQSGGSQAGASGAGDAATGDFTKSGSGEGSEGKPAGSGEQKDSKDDSKEGEAKGFPLGMVLGSLLVLGLLGGGGFFVWKKVQSEGGAPTSAPSGSSRAPSSAPAKAAPAQAAVKPQYTDQQVEQILLQNYTPEQQQAYQLMSPEQKAQYIAQYRAQLAQQG